MISRQKFIGFILLLLHFNATADIQNIATESNKVKERWFEIEIILFQNLKISEDTEYWPEEPLLTIDYSKDIALYHKFEASNETAIETNTTNTTNNKLTNKNESANQTQLINIRPFELIESSDQLKLNDVYNRLKSNRRYKPLLHYAWQQPLYPTNQSQWINIIPLEIKTTETDEEKQEQEPNTALEHNETDLTVSTDEDGLEVTDTTEPIIFTPLEGRIKVSVMRYLHIDTEIIFRQLKQITREIEDITPTSSLTPNTNFPASTQTTTPVAENKLHNEPETISATPVTTTITEEIVQEYPLKQHRKMRSKRLHYIDHPMIGLFILITAIDIENTDKIEIISPTLETEIEIKSVKDEVKPSELDN